MAVPKKKTSKAKSRSRRASQLGARRRRPAACARSASHAKTAPRGVPQLRLVQGPPGRSRSTEWPRGGARPEDALATLPVAVDAMGGDKAPGEIVAGARRAAERARHRGRAGRAARARWATPAASSSCPAAEVIGMDDDPGQRGAPQEGLLAGAGGRGRCATARPWPWSRPATPGRPWPRPCCAWAGCPAWSGPPSPRRMPRLGPHPDRAARRRGQRRVHARHAGAVRPDGRGLRSAALRHRPAPRWACSPSARRSPRARRWSRRPTASWPTAAAARRFDFVGQRRGPGPAARRRPT